LARQDPELRVKGEGSVGSDALTLGAQNLAVVVILSRGHRIHLREPVVSLSTRVADGLGLLFHAHPR